MDVVRAASSLEVSRSQCDLKFPERVHATNLRKHCATIAQVSYDIIVASFYFKLLSTNKTAVGTNVCLKKRNAYYKAAFQIKIFRKS